MVLLDHAGMRENCRKLGVEDYRLFCMALTQRYVPPDPAADPAGVDTFSKVIGSRGLKVFSRAQFAKLPEEEKQRLRKAIVDFHDRMFDVFQDVPPKLMLIFRNLNTIRSITK